MNRFGSGPWKIGLSSRSPVIIDSAPQSLVTVRTIFSGGPETKEQALFRIFGGEPFPLRQLPGLTGRYSWTPRLYLKRFNLGVSYHSSFVLSIAKVHSPCFLYVPGNSELIFSLFLSNLPIFPLWIFLLR